MRWPTNWRLTVSDNGVGQSASGAPEGTPGLGTSIVEALAKQLDGHVEIVHDGAARHDGVDHPRGLPDALPDAA